jgi:hypothetical protein
MQYYGKTVMLEYRHFTKSAIPRENGNNQKVLKCHRAKFKMDSATFLGISSMGTWPTLG